MLGTSEEVPVGFSPFHMCELQKARFLNRTKQKLQDHAPLLMRFNVQSQKSVFNIACLSVLEESSFTRKDGQYLRWDHRSGRRLRSHHKDLGPYISI